uniref:CDGSH iron-sulfur domain-containing protein 2 n=1 Tax=Pan troglodytes TaxID=9598 RepID=H2RF39_PANTR
MPQGLLSSELSPVSFRGKIPGFCREGAELGTGQSLSSPVLLIALFSEWLRLLPFLGVLALLGYLAVRPFLPKKKQQKDSLINLKIQKENPKVVNEINIEDLCLTKAAYCRCWRSKTFPTCDGSHNKHNELTGDNVGPLILKKKEV